MGTELGSSATAAGTLNNFDISPCPAIHFSTGLSNDL